MIKDVLGTGSYKTLSIISDNIILLVLRFIQDTEIRGSDFQT